MPARPLTAAPPPRRARCGPALCALFALAATAAALSGCGAASARSASPEHTFTDVLAALPTNLDETATPSTAASTVLPSFASELVGSASAAPGAFTRLPEASSVTPSLATGWRRLANGDYVFTLRRGVHGASGDELTANDVSWSVRRALARSPVAPFLLSLANVDARNPVSILGRYRVRINVTAPGPFMLAALSWFDEGIYDSALYRAHATAADPWAQQWGATHSASFGPYYVSQFIPGKELDLQANPGYWRRPYYTRVRILAVASSARRTSLLLTGAAMHTSALNWTDFDAVQQSGPLAGVSASILQSGPGVQSWLLSVNRSALADPRVRAALNMAINRTQIVGAIFDGHATPAVSTVPSIFGGGQPQVYDPARARRLLAAAGYSHGLTLELDSSGSLIDGASGEELSLLAAQLQAVGVTLDPVIVSDTDQLFALEQARAVPSVIETISPLLSGAAFSLEQDENAALDPVSPAAQEGVKDAALQRAVSALRRAGGQAAAARLTATATALADAEHASISIVATQLQLDTAANITGYRARAVPYTDYSLLAPVGAR